MVESLHFRLGSVAMVPVVSGVLAPRFVIVFTAEIGTDNISEGRHTLVGSKYSANCMLAVIGANGYLQIWNHYIGLW